MSGLRPFFCYYGGKWRAAPHYPSPVHDVIVEPFAGAAGYATRYHDRKIVLVEQDPTIAGLWKYLTCVSSAEIMRLPAEVPGTVDDLSICQEARWLIGFWCNKGASAPMKSPSAWMRSQVRPNSYWGATVREILARQVDSIRHWQVIEGPYDSAPNVMATWFVDPPYETAGKHYRYRTIDYPALASWVRTRKGQTIVCENVGATWLPFRPWRKVKGTPGAHGGHVSDEAIYEQTA